MKDQFTDDLQARLSAFVKTASIDTLSAAFAKANFEGYRHLKGSFFGITDGAFDEISVSATGQVTLNVEDNTVFDLTAFLASSYISSLESADHQDLAVAA